MNITPEYIKNQIAKYEEAQSFSVNSDPFLNLVTAWKHLLNWIEQKKEEDPIEYVKNQIAILLNKFDGAQNRIAGNNFMSQVAAWDHILKSIEQEPTPFKFILPVRKPIKSYLNRGTEIGQGIIIPQYEFLTVEDILDDDDYSSSPGGLLRGTEIGQGIIIPQYEF